jgi:type IV pilus assembly protein PilN
MIKVNLLRDHTVRARKAFAKPTGSGMGILLPIILLLVAVGGMAFWTHRVHQQIDEGQRTRADLRKIDDEMKRLNAEIAKYTRLKSQLEERIQAIDALREKRSGPVLLLNTVIHSIPSNANLWLTSLNQKSENIKIIGYTSQVEVIPGLMTNLMASGIFSSVDLELIERSRDASKFSLICISVKKYQTE